MIVGLDSLEDIYSRFSNRSNGCVGSSWNTLVLYHNELTSDSDLHIYFHDSNDKLRDIDRLQPPAT